MFPQDTYVFDIVSKFKTIEHLGLFILDFVLTIRGAHRQIFVTQ